MHQELRDVGVGQQIGAVALGFGIDENAFQQIVYMMHQIARETDLLTDDIGGLKM